MSEANEQAEPAPVESMVIRRRHKWNSRSNQQMCVMCNLVRQRPMSAIRRGRHSVSDWDYWIGGEWKRLHTVPPCEPE